MRRPVSTTAPSFLLGGRNDGAGGPLVVSLSNHMGVWVRVTFGLGLRPSMPEVGRLQGVA